MRRKETHSPPRSYYQFENKAKRVMKNGPSRGGDRSVTFKSCCQSKAGTSAADVEDLELLFVLFVRRFVGLKLITAAFFSRPDVGGLHS